MVENVTILVGTHRCWDRLNLRPLKITVRSFVYSPTRVLKSNTPDLTNADLPDARLELDFVYGYSAGCIVGAPSTEFGVLMGSDVQDNLCWLSDKVIVYFTAATGIVYDIDSHTQRYFFGHDDAIT